MSSLARSQPIAPSPLTLSKQKWMETVQDFNRGILNPLGGVIDRKDPNYMAAYQRALEKMRKGYGASSPQMRMKMEENFAFGRPLSTLDSTGGY